MCGIAGIYGTAGRSEELRATAETMAASLGHRGPDDAGSWASDRAPVAFGFRRLSIIDLSERGHQPMTSSSGRFTMVFNGEIYNYRALRGQLTTAGHSFRGESDSEVLLAAFEEWGVEDAVRRCVGMFAIALWDDRRRELHLVRDRLGIKPLFVGAGNGVVLFGSELKALLATPWLSREIDADSLASFFRYLYVPGPSSIFRGVRKLEPGHILTIGQPHAPLPPARSFWTVREVARTGVESPLPGSERELLDLLEERLAEVVRDRMYADVPLGALLSGGIDSSLVVALMQRESGSRQVRTYSVAFEEADYDESGHAARVAAHLGTEHTEVTLTPEEALGVVPRLPEMFDEPFASPSAIPNHLICAVARRDVTVALSGTGGDEVFAGYNRYLVGDRLIRLAGRVPSAVRRRVAAIAERVPYGGWGAILPWGLPGTDVRYPGRKAFKIARLLRQDDASSMYRSLVSAWDPPEEVLTRGTAAASPVEEATNGLGPRGDLLDAMLLADQSTYLVDDQLAKMDRVSMAVGLELRVPLLDHRLVELSWRLPPRLKRRGRRGKWALRRVLERYVPPELFDRPKMGLSVPLEHWLRGPLREWAADTLEGRALGSDSLIDRSAVRSAWKRFQDGQGALDLAVWTALVYGAWRERWLS